MKVRFALLVGVIACFSPQLALPATDMKSYQMHLDNGLRGIREKQLYWAKKEFEFIIRHEQWDPEHRSIAYLNLGVISAMEEDWNSAAKYYQAAIEINPSYAEAYFNLGGVYFKQKLQKKAEEAFLKAIEIQPEYGRAHYALGFIYLDQKKYDLAKKHAEKAAEYGVPFKTLQERLRKVGY